MSKKSNVTRADGLIAVQVYLGRVNGKRKYKTVYGKTQKEADKKADELKYKLGIGIDVAAEGTPFEVYRKQWLARKKDSVSPATYPSYESHANALKRLDGTAVGKIQEYHIQAIIDELAARNPTTGKPTSKKTLNNIKKAAIGILEIPRRQHIIYFNNAEGVRISRSAPKSNRRALSKEEMKMIEDTPHRAQTAAMIMLYAGLRRGEVSALRWSDIDFKVSTISVTRSVEFVQNKAYIKEGAKTSAGTRIVHIPERLLIFLKRRRGVGLIITKTNGTVMTNNAWRALWSSYMNQLNRKYGKFTKPPKRGDGTPPMLIKPFGCHDLRHTFATMLYQSGVDALTARDQMGHADVQTTIGIYTHLDQQFKEKKMERLDIYLKESASVVQVNEPKKA